MNRYDQFAGIYKNWVAPRELLHSPPRHVVLSGGGVALAVLGVILVLGAIAAAAFLGRESSRQGENYRLLQQEGREADARIVRRWWTKGENKRLRVKYEFAVEGRSYVKEVKVPKARANTVAEDGAIRIRFVPSNPAINHPAAWNSEPMPSWPAIVVGIGLLILAAGIAMALRRQMELLSEGRAAPAIVTKISKEQHQHGSSTIIHYEFPLLSGNIAKGKSACSRKGVDTGTVLPVVYDPNNTRRSAIYPLSLVRVE